MSPDGIPYRSVIRHGTPMQIPESGQVSDGREITNGEALPTHFNDSSRRNRLSAPARIANGNGYEPSLQDDSPDGNGYANTRLADRHRRQTRRSDEGNAIRHADDNDGLIGYVKPMQIGHWKVCFSGDTPPVSRYDVDIHRFHGQIDAICGPARLSKQAVLSQIMHLLAARDWFQLERCNIRTWEEFETKLKENFLTYTHDNELYAKATRRKQGKSESVASYINQMRLIFDAMSEPLADKFKLFLIKQNLHSRYTAIVASHCPRSVVYIMRIAREVENTRPHEAEADARPRPKYRSSNAVEKSMEIPSDSDDAKSSDGETERAKVAVIKTDKNGKRGENRKTSTPTGENAPVGSVEVACYICGSQDHLQRQCEQKWPKHCIRSGMPDVVLRDCKNCNTETKKNAKVNSPDSSRIRQITQLHRTKNRRPDR